MQCDSYWENIRRRCNCVVVITLNIIILVSKQACACGTAIEITSNCWSPTFDSYKSYWNDTTKHIIWMSWFSKCVVYTFWPAGGRTRTRSRSNYLLTILISHHTSGGRWSKDNKTIVGNSLAFYFQLLVGFFCYITTQSRRLPWKTFMTEQFLSCADKTCIPHPASRQRAHLFKSTGPC